jgi:hypothetical protein
MLVAVGFTFGQAASSTSWTLWAGVASPMFAGLTFVLAVLIPWWHRRKAGVEVRLECFQRIAGSNVSEETRLVIKNHGPATARDVHVKMGESGSGMPVPEQHWQLPIPLLYSGQEYHLPIYLYLGSTYPDTVDISWADARHRCVRRTVHLSLQYL